MPAKVVSLPPEAQRVSSPLQAKVWEAALAGHPNRQWVKLLLDGITLGVRLGFDGRPVRSAGRNLPSASENAAVVRDYLKKEQTRGSISSPWSSTVLVLYQSLASLVDGASLWTFLSQMVVGSMGASTNLLRP